MDYKFERKYGFVCINTFCEYQNGQSVCGIGKQGDCKNYEPVNKLSCQNCEYFDREIDSFNVWCPILLKNVDWDDDLCKDFENKED